MTLSLGFNGAGVLTNLHNSQDLSPNFCATIYGIINMIGTTAGFISPMVVAILTREKVRNQNNENSFFHCENHFVFYNRTLSMSGQSYLWSVALHTLHRQFYSYFLEVETFKNGIKFRRQIQPSNGNQMMNNCNVVIGNNFSSIKLIWF